MILLKTDATNATMSCGNASSHFLMVGTGFLIVHGVVWLRQTQRMMKMMRKTRSQCSCCLRRLALLGLPRGSPGVSTKTSHSHDLESHVHDTLAAPSAVEDNDNIH